jgi:hypothetical protein
VPPCVRYETTCLLIRDDVGIVTFLDEWEIDVVNHLGSDIASGVVVLRTTPENLSMVMLPRTTLAKLGI